MNPSFFKKTFSRRGDSASFRDIARALPGLPWLAAVSLAAALAVTGLAGHKLKTVVGEARTVTAAKPVNYKLVREPLSANEYQAILSWFQRLHPDVTFQVVKEGGLLVATKDGAHHTEWLNALASLQSRDRDVVWEAPSFCVGRCTGAAAVAEVKGYRQKIQRD